MRINAWTATLGVSAFLALLCSAGCDEQKSMLEQLQERNDALTLEASQLRASLAEANRDLGVLQEQRSQQESNISRLTREAQNLRNRQRSVESDRAELEEEKEALERQLATVRSFINDKDNLYAEIEVLKEDAARVRSLASELDSANAKYETLQGNATKQITALQDRITELTETIDFQNAAVEEGRRAINELEEARQSIDILARSHPEYFLSTLETYESLSDEDLFVWNDVSLSYTGGIRSLGAELSLTLPLAVLDHRGPVRLTYGSLEVTAISMLIDLDKGMAKIGFPDDRKLRDSMSLNSSTSILVSFGPEDNRSVLKFSIGAEEEKLGMTTVPFLLQEIGLGDLPVARKIGINRWALVQ